MTFLISLETATSTLCLLIEQSVFHDVFPLELGDLIYILVNC